MMKLTHDPVPDGKSGPWLRERHLRDEVGRLTYDERCDGCREGLLSPGRSDNR